MAVLTKVVICASLEYGFVSLTSVMKKTTIELVAGTRKVGDQIRERRLGLARRPRKTERKQVETAGEKRKLELSMR